MATRLLKFVLGIVLLGLVIAFWANLNPSEVTNPEAPAVSVVTMLDPDEMTGATHNHFSELTDEEMEALRVSFSDFLMARHESLRRNVVPSATAIRRMSEFQAYLNEAGRRDGEGSLEWIRSFPTEMGLHAYSQRIIEGWLKVSRDELVAYLSKSGSGNELGAIQLREEIDYFVLASLEEEPAEYLEWISLQEGSQFRDQCIESLVFALGDEDLARLGDVLGQSGGEVDMAVPFADRFASAAPNEAITWSLERDSDRLETTQAVFARIAQDDPDLGIEMLNGGVGSRLVNEWSQSEIGELLETYISNLVLQHGDDVETLIDAQISITNLASDHSRGEMTQLIEDSFALYFTSDLLPDFRARVAANQPPN